MAASKKSFSFEFDDEGPRTLTFDYDGRYEQRLETSAEDGVVVLFLNRQACTVLAKMLAKIALGSYEPGFHVHLEQDLNADKPEALRVVLLSDTEDSPAGPPEDPTP
jgi:hypothetical protein